MHSAPPAGFGFCDVYHYSTGAAPGGDQYSHQFGCSRECGIAWRCPAGVKVLFLAAEMAPLVKVGGLADVAGSLPPALRALGHDVRGFLPFYRRFLDPAACRPLGRNLRLWGLEYPLHYTEEPGFPVYLLEADGLYDRPGVYGEGGDGYHDNDLRYGVFAAAGAALGEAAGWRPDLLHLHDWHAAATAVHARLQGGPPTLLTIHNLAYQGVFARESLGRLGFAADLFHPGAVEFHGQVNVLKGGLVAAGRVGTVSPTYAGEICTRDYGEGLEGVLANLAHPPVGILNGLDQARWNPAADAAVEPVDAGNPRPGKAANKARVARELDLEEGRPLAGMVTRLAAQKGVDLVVEALPDLLASGLNLAVLGDGDRELLRSLEEASRDHPGRLAFRREFNDPLARRIYAGSDLFLVPSRFEPCGLTQMIAMRYGSVPVVRRTGGLADTVRDGEDGFVFAAAKAQALVEAVRRALASLEGGRGQEWLELVRRGMSRDFSWDRSAGRYAELYRETAEVGA